MLGAGRAVVLEAFGTVVSAELAGLLDRVGEQAQTSGLDASRFGVACGGRGIEHALEDGRVLASVSTVAEVTGDGDGADRAYGLDAVVACRGAEHIAAGGADAERSDTFWID